MLRGRQAPAHSLRGLYPKLDVEHTRRLVCWHDVCSTDPEFLTLPLYARLFPLSSPSLSFQDTPGILARTVLDSAMVLDIIAGPDSKDSTCIPSTSRGGGDGGFASGLLEAAAAPPSSGPLEGVTVGIPREFNAEELGETNVEGGGRPPAAGWQNFPRILEHHGGSNPEEA